MKKIDDDSLAAPAVTLLLRGLRDFFFFSVTDISYDVLVKCKSQCI